MSRDGGSDATECPSCGTQADAADRFCSACGTVLARGHDGESVAPTTPSESPAEPGAETARGTDGERTEESEEMVWATDPASAEPDDTTTGADDGPVASADDDGPEEVPTAGPSAGATDSRAREGGDQGAEADRHGGAAEDDRSGTVDADEAALEPWQKRCPECGSVLVAQAVRCTGCGARQPDVAEAEDGDGRRQPQAQGGASDAGSDGAESPPRRREAGESHYRERPRRERREDPRHTRDPRDREPAGRTTDAGGGEVQYERERRADPVASEREPPREAPGGYRERTRREPPRREAHRRPAPEHDRRERLADRQSARRADEETPYEPSVPSSRWWVGVLVPAVLTVLGAAVGVAADPTAVAGGMLPWVGDGGGLLELGVVLTPTLAPFALYFDRRYVAHETGRTPSAAYYLVAVPYLNIVVTGLYLWWRQQWLAEA